MRTYTIQPHSSSTIPRSPEREEPRTYLRPINKATNAELDRWHENLSEALLTDRPDDIELAEWNWNRRWVEKLILAIENERYRRFARALHA